MKAVVPGNRTEGFLQWVEQVRQSADARLDPDRRVELGQFLSPDATARLVAGMADLDALPAHVRVLDPGAGVGSLTAALVARLCGLPRPPQRLSVTAYEVDQGLHHPLMEVLHGCFRLCAERGIRFESRAVAEDFIEAGVASIRRDLFAPSEPPFDLTVMNPPYRKIATRSRHRALLSSIGIETSNLYSAFLAVAIQLLRNGGEMVAITPRSFCNGSYFRAFRRWFLNEMTLRQIHLFDARDAAFKDNGVLQENIVFRATRSRAVASPVLISSNRGPNDGQVTTRSVDIDHVVHPNDPDAFIRLVPDENGHDVARTIGRLPSSLRDLGVTVSTGRVVDFRAATHLVAHLRDGTVPLIYPIHCRNGTVQWPRADAKKPNAIAVHPDTLDLLVPAGYYVLVKRFTAKEERRRVVAVVCAPDDVPADRFAIENHLNYAHRGGRGLPKDLAVGLATFLNSTMVDRYFRQFSGHTQVNANDLRNLRYPSEAALTELGRLAAYGKRDQVTTDRLVETGLAEWVK